MKERLWRDSPGWKMPISFAMASAVGLVSPVIMTTRMPAVAHALMAAGTSGRAGSLMPTMPTNVMFCSKPAKVGRAIIICKSPSVLADCHSKAAKRARGHFCRLAQDVLAMGRRERHRGAVGKANLRAARNDALRGPLAVEHVAPGGGARARASGTRGARIDCGVRCTRTKTAQSRHRLAVTREF
eukprot:scaffold290714_cov31-Tisochrysis_lutea.AAC.2